MKKSKVPVKVVERARALAQAKTPVKLQAKPPALEKKAKLVAALKRLHPMD